MNIDVIDGLGHDGFVRESRRAFPNAIHATSVSQMVMAIITRLGSNTLQRLRIIGHGAAGVQGIADSHTTMDENRLIQVDSTGTLQNPGILSLLAASFEPHGFVELHGCQVARGYQGKMLLARLNTLWRVPVRAGATNQTNVAGFEGTTHTARTLPGGGVQVR